MIGIVIHIKYCNAYRLRKKCIVTPLPDWLEVMDNTDTQGIDNGGRLEIKPYDKRDDSSFPTSLSSVAISQHGVCISQLIH